MLFDIRNGTKAGGLNYYNFTVDLVERDLETQETIPSLIETSLKTDELKQLLTKVYARWNTLTLRSVPYEEVMFRNGKQVLWKCDYLLFTAQSRPLF